MRILMLLPTILYLGLVIFNLDSLKDTKAISFYGFINYNIPIFLYLTIFVVVYTIFIILIFDFTSNITSKRIRKLEKEVFELKSKLYDEREDELVVFLTEQKQRIENFIEKQKQTIDKIQSDNQLVLAEQKSDTNRILDKFGLLEDGLLDKIKRSFKGKNLN